MAGRLAYFVNTWRVTDHKGFQIPLVGQPVQERKPRVPSFPSEQLVQMQEISSLLEKGAVTVVDSHLPQTVSTVSGPQEEWGNEASNQPQGPQPVGKHPSLKNGGPTHPKKPDWLVKVDLKDAYLTVPIHPDHQCHLWFSIEEVNYQFTCLPFGLACAPWAFTKVMKAIVTLLRSWGTRIIIYIDDILIIAESAVQAS